MQETVQKLNELLQKFHTVAANPAAQKEAYLAQGKKIVLTAPVYTPEEIVHSMGMVPMGAWGADTELKEAKRYYPAFICSIVQSLVELGMTGVYDGASAIIIPSLCDSLKVAGQNWKYAVPSIPFIPMSYPQNRKPGFGFDFTKAGYERVIRDLEAATGESFDDGKLHASIEVYNRHNKVMRDLVPVLAQHPGITAAQRSDIFKSAWFMLKEEHTVLVEQLIELLNSLEPLAPKTGVYLTGILADAPSFLEILDDCGFQVVGDDIAAESRQYRTDAPAGDCALDRLAAKFCAMDNCSVLYDPAKKRVQMIAEEAAALGAKGVIAVMTKFCDPEEFDYPLIRNACRAADMPMTSVEVDRQMVNYEQARTALETFRDLLEMM